MSEPTATPAAPAAPAPGTPAHDAAMAAKFDGVQSATPAAPATPAPEARPAWLPEKFKSAEDLAAAYKALESKLGTTPATPPAAPASDPAKPAPVENKLAIPADPAAKAVADAGLDMGKLQSEFLEHGDLTPETRTALQAKGFPKEMVDGYIAGQKALAAQYDAAAFSTAGGEAEYGKLVTWAKTGLTPQEAAAFNAQVSSGDTAAMQLAVSGLKARYTAALGSQPNLLGGTPAPAGDVYESMAQVTADMKKPEYRNDPAFRAKVEAKIGRSQIGVVTERN